MERVWYRRDREAVLAALRRGERADMATTMASGPLDELVALHEELGILAALDVLPVPRARAGLADGLLLRTLATLPFLKEAALGAAAGALFREPAILLHLGWAPARIRAGDNQRHRHSAGRRPESLPCHPDTLRDEVRPEFLVLTGNDLAIDMVVYGSDYLLGLSTFAPDLFARRDRLWAEGDPAFYELNDVLQHLGHLTFRPPVPAYRHDAAIFFQLRGWASSDATPTGVPRRPPSDRDLLAAIAEQLGVLA
jgi:hypothetical protein